MTLPARFSLAPSTDEATLQGISNLRRWFLVCLLTLAAVINYLDRATISVALPMIATELSLGPTEKGLVLSSFFWCYTLLQVPVGVLVDRSNLRWLFAGAFTLWSVSCGLNGFIGGLASLIVVRVILGIGESILLPGSMKLVHTLFDPRDRGLPTGLCASGTRAGLALGTPLIAWLIVRYGWRMMFVIVGFSALVWLIPWFLAFPPESPQRGESPGLDKAADPGGRKWFTLDRNLIGCCLGHFSFGYYQYVLMAWLPDYFVNVRHLHILQAGIYASLSYLIWGLGAAVGGWFSDLLIRRGWNETRVRKGVITAAFATGFLLIPAVYVTDARAAMMLVAAASLVGISSANKLVILQDCAPPGEVGAWAGMANFVGNLGGVLSPLIMGILVSKTGSYIPGFVLSLVVLIAGVLPYWFIVGELKPKGEAAIPR